MQIKRLIGIIILAGSLMTTSCANPQPGGENGLEAAAWELITLHNSPPIAKSKISISFENGEISGNAGCNSYFGNYAVKGREIQFGPIAMTEMACLDPDGAMEQEQAYLALLAEIDSFSVEGDQLILRKDGQEQLVFQKSAEN